MTTPTSVTDSPRPGWWRRYWWLASLGAVLAIAAAVSAGYVGARNTIAAHDHTANADEQAMAVRAAAVMPFDLNPNTHTVIKKATGRVAQVVANDPGDRRNITLIRQHLLKE